MPPVRKQRRDSAEGRRAFLKSAIKGLAALFGLLIATAAALSLIPRGGSGRREMRLLLGDEDEAPRRGAREMAFSYDRGGRKVTGRVILVQSPAGLIALSPACTHLGCHVVWREDPGEFLCPCHGGRYDVTGKNIA